MTTSKHTKRHPVFVAIDVAKARHQVLIEEPNGKRSKVAIDNSKADFELLVKRLKAYKTQCEVAFEPTGDYHRPIAAFLGREGFHLHFVSSMATNRTREAMYNTWDKNDPKDAQVILHLLKTGTTQIYHDPTTHGYNDLQELSKTYRQVSLRKVRIYHSIVTHYLPLYFPEAEAYIANSRTEWLTHVLLLGPCPSAVLRYTKKEFIQAASAIQRKKFDRSLWLSDYYDAAKNSVGVPVGEDSQAIRTFRMVLNEYLHVCRLRQQLEEQAQLFLADHPDFARLQTIPGVGPVVALTILAESGDLRRFAHHRQYLNFCGLDLCTDQSGRSRGPSRLSKRGNARLRNVFWLAAVIAIHKRENTFRAKFERYISSDPKNPDLKRKAYTAVAAKVARVAYGLLKSNTDYRRFFEAA